jgi:hypothetical protein
MGLAADDDRLRSAQYQPRNVLADDRLAEDGAVQEVAQRAVRAAIHPLQVELRHPCFVGRNGGAFHAAPVLGDRMRRIDGDLVVGLFAIFDAEIVLFQADIEVWQNQLVLDEPPDDAGHLLAVEFTTGGFTFIFAIPTSYQIACDSGWPPRSPAAAPADETSSHRPGGRAWVGGTSIAQVTALGWRDFRPNSYKTYTGMSQVP